jgi:N-acetyl-alpha-D-muramate 1-phosphate uridylyltransferase
MADSVAALVLGAGAGTRLRPLTRLRPKVLCPVGGVPLLDRAASQVSAVVGSGPGAVAVNANHLADQVVAHAAGRLHVSMEEGQALGTAGAVAHLRAWLDGRSVIVVNGDTWHDAELATLTDGWDGVRVRILVAGTEAVLGPRSRVIGSIMPPAEIARLPLEPTGLWEVCWRRLLGAGELDVVAADVSFRPCDRPRDYLAANLLASGGESVVGEGAVVEGTLVRSVVWPGAVVERTETLVDAIRATDRVTVLIR